MEATNNYVTLKDHIEGAPTESDFQLKSATLLLRPEPGSNDVIVKNLCVSIDPFHINRMKKHTSYQKYVAIAKGLIPGQAIDAFGVGRVMASLNPGFVQDDLVFGLLGWEEYSVVPNGETLRKIESSEFPLSYHLGVLGFSGFTAYCGFYKICKPEKQQKVFVSAASGSVGNLVGQLAKLFGCYVIGSAGSKEKVDLLINKLGFDNAFNYKEEFDLIATLKRFFPEGIDIYFDNVGGEMLAAAVANMNSLGRVAACGAISEYTGNVKITSLDMLDIVIKQITIQGFILPSYMDMYPEFFSTMCDHLRHGKIHVLEDLSYGVKSIPYAFVGLFRGSNIGKKIVQIAED